MTEEMKIMIQNQKKIMDALIQALNPCPYDAREEELLREKDKIRKGEITLITRRK